MKVTGEATLHAPVARVYAALNDPAVLVRTIPGCERLEAVGQDAYRMTVTAGVASIKGSYAGDVRLTDQVPPERFVLHATGAGAPGTVSADVLVSLASGGDGSTVVRYDADAVVGGAVGGVGQRILTGVARRTAGEFFAAVDGVLAGGDGRPVAQPEAGTAPASDQPAAAAVYTAPPAVPRAGAPGGEFVRGVLVGAAVALLGVVVGRWAGRR